MSLAEVDRVNVVTVVDNYIDSLRRDEPVARRFSLAVARLPRQMVVSSVGTTFTFAA